MIKYTQDLMNTIKELTPKERILLLSVIGLGVLFAWVDGTMGIPM
jgi:hypothetical protein